MSLGVGTQQLPGSNPTQVPSVLQRINLLPMPKLELVARMFEETRENLGLEIEEDFDFNGLQRYLADVSRPPPTGEADDDSNRFERLIQRRTTLHEHLAWQLGTSRVPEPIRRAAEAIIGNLNDAGFLVDSDRQGQPVSVDLEDLCQAGQNTMDEMEKGLELVQSFDPVGVGARNLRECLLLQLTQVETENSLAFEIIDRHLPLLQKRRYREIARSIGCSIQEVLRARELITKLDSNPGLNYGGSEPVFVLPEATFVKVEGAYKVLADDDGLPHLRLSPSFLRLLQQGELDRDARSFLRERLRAARQFMKLLDQRERLIGRVCKLVAEYQAEFFDSGPERLKPLTMQQVADELGVESSTVSRCVKNKYVDTPQGVVALRSLFSAGGKGDVGANTSINAVRYRIKEMIEAEDKDHPLTDQEIADQLSAEGMLVTRRNVAEYRKVMGIPGSRSRG